MAVGKTMTLKEGMDKMDRSAVGKLQLFFFLLNIIVCWVGSFGVIRWAHSAGRFPVSTHYVRTKHVECSFQFFFFFHYSLPNYCTIKFVFFNFFKNFIFTFKNFIFYFILQFFTFYKIIIIIIILLLLLLLFTFKTFSLQLHL